MAHVRGSKYESHYTVWTAWISIRVRVRVRVYFILQNLAPLALPYMCPQPYPYVANAAGA